MENVPMRRGRRPRMAKPDLAPQVEGEAPAAEEDVVDAYTPGKVLRPPMRKEYSLASAADRTAEILGHVGTVAEGVDEFYIDRSRLPPGWDAEWKTKTVLGAEDPAQMVAYARMGWEPAPLDMFPEMMPQGWKGNTIERKGMILMIRPRQITDMVRQADARKAREQIRAKEAQLSSAPDGQFTRDHDKVKPKINKGFEPMPIPQD
jgi:hypothetical protein